MDIDKIKPHDTYDGLRTQFFAMKNILKSKQVEIGVYREQISRFNLGRIVQLEAELESQKEMNAILTEELNQHGKD